MAAPEQQLGFYMRDYEVVQQPRFCLNPAQLLGELIYFWSGYCTHCNSSDDNF